MNKDINRTLTALVPILRMNGEMVKSIEAVNDWYKVGDREYLKEVAEITYDNGTRRYADIGCDSNLTAVFDVVAVIQRIKPRSSAIERIEKGVYRQYPIENLTAADVKPVRWIPTEERLPEAGGTYLCVWQGKTVDTGFFCNGHFRLYGEIKDHLITHWMPLPELPSVNGKGAEQ